MDKYFHLGLAVNSLRVLNPDVSTGGLYHISAAESLQVLCQWARIAESGTCSARPAYVDRSRNTRSPFVLPESISARRGAGQPLSRRICYGLVLCRSWTGDTQLSVGPGIYI